jgi:hypothetical protein
MNLISLNSKALLVAFVLALPAGMTSRASAAVLSNFSVSPTSILEGDSATLHLELTLIDPNPAVVFLGGSVTLFSGLGPPPLPPVPIGVGGTTRDFFATFFYPTAGTYKPSFLVLGLFFGDPDKPVPILCADGCRIEGSALLTVTATPLPAALPLFGSGLGLMGLVGWWRKKRAYGCP